MSPTIQPLCQANEHKTEWKEKNIFFFIFFTIQGQGQYNEDRYIHDRHTSPQSHFSYTQHNDSAAKQQEEKIGEKNKNTCTLL